MCSPKKKRWFNHALSVPINFITEQQLLSSLYMVNSMAEFVKESFSAKRKRFELDEAMPLKKKAHHGPFSSHFKGFITSDLKDVVNQIAK